MYWLTFIRCFAVLLTKGILCILKHTYFKATYYSFLYLIDNHDDNQHLSLSAVSTIHFCRRQLDNKKKLNCHIALLIALNERSHFFKWRQIGLLVFVSYIRAMSPPSSSFLAVVNDIIFKLADLSILNSALHKH